MIKSVSKSLLSVGLIFVAAGSLAASKTASAQSLQPPPNNLPFTLHNLVTGLCLAVSGNDPNPGGQLIAWPCNGTPSQSWTQGDPTAQGMVIGTQTYTLVNGISGLVAGVQAGVMQNNTPVITWTEDPTNFGQQIAVDNQGWAMIFADTNDGNDAPCFYFANAGGPIRTNPFFLALQNDNPGAKLVIYRDVNSNGFPNGPYVDQLWCMYLN